MPSSPKRSIPKRSIPKIMHPVWLSREPLPEAAQEYIANWERLHPGWQHRLWTSENLPKMVNRDLFDAANGWAAKTDILRYELMLTFGGVYVDVDMEPRKNIEALIAGLDAFAPRFREETSPIFNPDFALEIAILGSIPGYPLFERIVSQLGLWHHLHPLAGILYATGPHYFSLQVNEWKRGDTEGFSLTEFEPKVFQPYEWFETDKEAMPHLDSYAIHRCWGSWNNWNGRPPAQ